jgi:hypothetical protein
MATEVRRYRKLVEVDAILWTGDNIEAVHGFMAPVKPAYMGAFSNADELLGLPSGVATVGDWVVRDLDTQTFSHMSNKDFEATYEPANNQEVE